MRVIATVMLVSFAAVSAASGQSFATFDQPSGSTASGTPAPAVTSQGIPLETVPVYKAYEPEAFDSQAYQSATDAEVTVSSVPVFTGQPETELAPVVPAVPVEKPSLSPVPSSLTTQETDFSRALGAPETFASEEPAVVGQPNPELGFQSETETSRLLLALEETYATRVSQLKTAHLAQRRSLLDQFEQDAADSTKVIGLAGRMKTALAELETAQKASLQLEEKQYFAAMLKVLDAAPSRVE